jgi:hypothetical protein
MRPCEDAENEFEVDTMLAGLVFVLPASCASCAACLLIADICSSMSLLKLAESIKEDGIG